MQVIELLIDKGANIHQMDYHDHSPLHYACVWGWVDTVELLLEKGADPRRFGGGVPTERRAARSHRRRFG